MSDQNKGPIYAGQFRTFKTFSISRISIFFASAFMSTFSSPSPSPISSPSIFTLELTPSPPIFPRRPQNSTNEFSPSISSNAIRDEVVRSRCHSSYSSSTCSMWKPSLITGGDDKIVSNGKALKGVESVVACERNRVCKLLIYFDLR